MNKILIYGTVLFFTACAIEHQAPRSPPPPAVESTRVPLPTPKPAELLPEKSARELLKDGKSEGKIIAQALIANAKMDPQSMYNGELSIRALIDDNHVHILRAMKDEKVPINVRWSDENGRTLAFYARTPEMLAELLEIDDELLTVPDKDGSTLLHIAAESENVELISYVVDLRCSRGNPWGEVKDSIYGNVLNARDSYARAPLHLAVATGNTTIVNKLASCRSVNVSAKDNMGRTPLHYAATHQDFLAGYALLFHAGHIRARDLANVKDIYLETPLHIASRCDSDIAIDVLKGLSDLHARSSSGRLPLPKIVRDCSDVCKHAK